MVINVKEDFRRCIKKIEKMKLKGTKYLIDDFKKFVDEDLKDVELISHYDAYIKNNPQRILEIERRITELEMLTRDMNFCLHMRWLLDVNAAHFYNED